jgi:protein translocase SecG subunit
MSFLGITIQNWFIGLEVACLVGSVILILIQNRGSGLSSSLGGQDEVYLTRRGIEKSVVNLTVVLICLFVCLRIGSFYLPQPASSSSPDSNLQTDLQTDLQTTDSSNLTTQEAEPDPQI